MGAGMIDGRGGWAWQKFVAGRGTAKCLEARRVSEETGIERRYAHSSLALRARTAAAPYGRIADKDRQL